MFIPDTEKIVNLKTFNYSQILNAHTKIAINQNFKFSCKYLLLAQENRFLNKYPVKNVTLDYSQTQKIFSGTLFFISGELTRE